MDDKQLICPACGVRYYDHLSYVMYCQCLDRLGKQRDALLAAAKTLRTNATLKRAYDKSPSTALYVLEKDLNEFDAAIDACQGDANGD